MEKIAIYCPEGSGTLRQQLTILHYLSLSCTILHYVTSSCTILHHDAPCCTMLHHVAPCRTMLHQVAPCCLQCPEDSIFSLRRASLRYDDQAMMTNHRFHRREGKPRPWAVGAFSDHMAAKVLGRAACKEERKVHRPSSDHRAHTPPPPPHTGVA